MFEMQALGRHRERLDHLSLPQNSSHPPEAILPLVDEARETEHDRQLPRNARCVGIRAAFK